MSFSSSFGSQLAAILDVLVKAAVAEITKLVDDESVSLQLEVCQRDAEIQELRRTLELMEAELCKEAFTIRETEERQEELPAAENQVLLRVADIKEDEDTSAVYPESKTADSLCKTPNETDENFRPAVKQEPADELITTETTDNTVAADISFEGGKRDDSTWLLPACSVSENISVATQQQIQTCPSRAERYSAHRNIDSLCNSSSTAAEDVVDNYLSVPIKVEVEVRPKCMGNNTSESAHNEQFEHVLEQVGSSLPPPSAQASTAGMLASNSETNVWRANQKVFTCYLCNKGFPCLSQLEEHRSTHQTVKPFRCLQCGKSFAHKVRQQTHQRVHTGERPFSCTICGKMFSRQDNCVRHERFHSGQKPHSCRLCGKSFTGLRNLKLHQDIHLQGREGR
ncbi:gastrula zinc finger protein XlCGF52.1-like [Amphiprion ocellaris]|uniref:gastrula zinc finger protein XlCGF52.1-like n=1 Tax=Amphiprion ocellaris TaxID=80972 RepID=UPI0024110EF2|nr:gastrula zinc finger protein XlCGF52.1-like [Amphiprion ocellaris]